MIAKTLIHYYLTSQDKEQEWPYIRDIFKRIVIRYNIPLKPIPKTMILAPSFCLCCGKDWNSATLYGKLWFSCPSCHGYNNAHSIFLMIHDTLSEWYTEWEIECLLCHVLQEIQQAENKSLNCY